MNGFLQILKGAETIAMFDRFANVKAGIAGPNSNTILELVEIITRRFDNLRAAKEGEKRLILSQKGPALGIVESDGSIRKV